jgi:hypothetical protein
MSQLLWVALCLASGFLWGCDFIRRQHRRKESRVWILQIRSSGQVLGVWNHSPTGDEIWNQMLLRANGNESVARGFDSTTKIFSQEIV